uniref:Portal protein n=1 Tax=viral metagenome TaxID=1070528 RepID=A0A6H1Z973_9ZZZZ
MPEDKAVGTVQHRFNDTVEQALASIVVDNEYDLVRNQNSGETSDLEVMVDMLECKRSAKDYEWMSDVFLPELPAVILSEASDWANQYFQTRDFVEVKLEGAEPGNKERCTAAKKLLNETLNRRGLYHFFKYVRSRAINALFGQVWAIAWWTQRTTPTVVGMRDVTVPLDVDIYGNPLEDTQNQIPATRVEQEPVYGEHIYADQFDYDVLDPRNVFTLNTYDYSPQSKPWVIIRAERTYEELKAEAKDYGYFNLNLVRAINPPSETETSRETYNKDNQKQKPPKSPLKPYDVITRFGPMWARVTQRGEDGYPIAIEPGLDERGEPLEDAELVEAVVTFVLSGSNKILICFKPQMNRDGRGNPFRPLIRGLCYIHPTKDSGLSDGKNMQELQKAVNDTFNMAADRTKLATMPTLKGRKYALEDNTTIYFEPEHVMELEDPEKDIVEFKIEDDVTGALSQIGMLRDAMYQVTARFPTTMGSLPEHASTTATAVAGAETRTSGRTNYKSLTFEYTFLLDFYWIILQMTAQYARPQTLQALMGEDWVNFDPDADYKYSPLSANIEQEQNKYRKLSIIDQMMGRVANIPNPNTPKVLNYLLKMAFELFGNEFPDFAQYMFDESPQAAQQQMMAQGGAQMMPEGNILPISNQNALPQGNLEQYTRSGMYGQA